MKDVRQINDFIRSEMEGGKSLFQVALGLDDETRLAIMDCKLPEFLPYARLAAWFVDFFENSDGHNYLQSSWDDDGRRSDIPRQCWQSVFPDVELSEESFKSQCWLLDFNDERGSTSNLWRALKLCLDTPRDNRFIGESYDDAPDHLKLLCDAYQRGLASGKDFAEFVEALDCGNANGCWYEKLYDNCKLKFENRAHVDVYLHWSGGVSLGIGVGVDRIKGKASGLYFDRQKQGIPCREKFYPIYEKARVHYVGIRPFDVEPSLTGVYYRYNKSYKDPRYSWWKRIPVDGVVPFDKDEVLVYLPERVEVAEVISSDGLEIAENEIVDMPVRQKDHSSSLNWFARLAIGRRPSKESFIEIPGVTRFKVAGASPQIMICRGECGDVSLDEGVVCCGECEFRVNGEDQDLNCEWKCENVSTCEDSLGLNADFFGDVGVRRLRISCRIRNERNLVKHVLWLHQDLVNNLKTGNEGVFKGWKMSKCLDGETLIKDRILGRLRYHLVGPGNEREEVFVQDSKFFFWFAQGFAEWEGDPVPCEGKVFPTKGETDEWFLCFPSDIAHLEFSLNGNRIEAPSAEAVDQIRRIRLADLTGSDDDFVYSKEVRSLTLQCNGHVVALLGEVPKKPRLCQNDNREWGIYLPPSKAGWGRYIVVLYTDNTNVPGFLNPNVKDTDTAKESDTFLSLQDYINEYVAADQVGELFLALMPGDKKYDTSLLSGVFLKGDCQVRRIRPRAERFADGQNLGLIKVVHSLLKDKIPEGHVYSKSRIAQYQDTLLCEEIPDYWNTFVNSGNVQGLGIAIYEMLCAGYNPLMEPEWFFHAREQLLNGVCKREGQKRITGRIREKVYLSLIDNGDDRNGRRRRGDGYCAALVGQEEIDAYANLAVADNAYRITERTRLAKVSLTALGIQAVLDDGYERRFSIRNVDGQEVCLGPNNCSLHLNYVRRDQLWHLFSLQYGRQVREDHFRFSRFEMDVNEFMRVKYGEFKEHEHVQRLVENDGYGRDKFDAICSKIKDCCQFMRNGTGEIVSQIANALLEHGGYGDDALIVLIGLAISVRNSVCREEEPEGWTFKHGDECYETVNDVVRTLFERKVRDGEPIWWRKLMREIVAYMGIFSYLNVPIQ